MTSQPSQPVRPVTQVPDVTPVASGSFVPVTPRETDSAEFESLTRSKEFAYLVDLHADLRAITTTSDKSSELIKRYLDAVANRGRLFGIAWLESSGEGTPTIIESRFKNPSMDNSPMRQHLVHAAELTSHSPKPQILRSDKIRGSVVVCLPLLKNNGSTAFVCGILHDDKAKCTEAMLICQSVVDHFYLWSSRRELTKLANEIRSAASVLELVGKTECSTSLKDACTKVSNELQSLFRCEYVAVGLKSSNIASCRLIAISALAEFDHQSRTTTLICSAFDEAIVRGKYTSFPPPPDKQDSPALSHRKLSQHLRCEGAITVPLRNEEEKIVGAITVLGNRQLDRNPATRNLINALEHPVGNCLEVVKLAEGGWFRKLQRIVVSPEKTSTKWALWAMVLISIIAMMIPVPYRINSKCIAEPVNRSFCVAPYEGLLENTFVEPGDVVSRGQLLARMDGREIGSQISSAIADKNRAAKEHDAYLANGEISESIRADLERRGLEAKLSILNYKQQNLEVKSQIDGVVLSGSIDKRENFPVTIGQTLYEIAPIHPLRVELAIPADEIMHVAEGLQVKFRFDGFGTRNIAGIVERIRPSSTIRDDQNVFIAEAVLENLDGQVRPGMKGFARVYGKKHTLGWALFHRPWEKFVTAIGF